MRSPATLVSLLVAVLLLLLLPSLAQVGSAGIVDLEPGATSDESRFQVPETVEFLTEERFDAYVFAKRERPQSWFILFFAPWCEHCRALIPQFFNASALLEHEVGSPHARFAIVNSQRQPRLMSRFRITTFPTLVYTTGREEHWHHFQGGRSTDSFVEFAVYLQRAVDAGSFADDVSDMHRFAAVEAESGAFRVPFYVFVPRESTSTREHQRSAAWSLAVDGAASIGNARFGVLYERDISPAWREEGGAVFVEVVEAALRCKSQGLASGPAGEVLVSRSDRFRGPQCFSGPWLTTAGEAAAAGAEPQPRLHPLLERYITVNGFRAVEEVNSGLFSILGQQRMNYLGLIVYDGPLEQTDQNILPVIRDMVQTANEKLVGVPTEEALETPQVTWAYINGAVYELWRSRYNIKMQELPAFLLVDTVRNRMFRTRTRLPEFEKIKREVPWAVDGPQRRLLEEFVADVLAEKYWGEKQSLLGYMSERLTYYRALRWVYARLGYDDLIFMAVTLASCFFAFLMFIAFVAEPWMERNLAKQQAREAEARKKAQ